MKRKILIFLLINFSYLFYSQTISYYTKTQTYLFDTFDIFKEIPLNEQGILINKDNKYLYNFDNSYYCFPNNENYSLIEINNGNCLLLDDLIRINFNKNIHKQINGTWIASYYYDVYFSNNRKELLKNERFWENEWKYDGQQWEDTIYPTFMYITDNYFIITTNDGFERSYLITEENDSFYFTVYLGGEFLSPDFYSQSNFINKIKEKGLYKFKIIIDGDYLNLYDEKENLLMSFAKTLDRFNDRTYLRKIANNQKINLNDITWPRHADGTCDYDGSSKSSKTAVSTKSTTPTASTNVAVNKTMTAYENLKLRSGEATTTSVLTVMQAGTKVKILELGKAETIDGIDSNWVKVEVQKGAKDRNGKEIKSGTTGWCYGGYLE